MPPSGHRWPEGGFLLRRGRPGTMSGMSWRCYGDAMNSADDAIAAAQVRVRLRADLRSGRARQARKQARLTQHEVASAIGVSQATVALYEAGRRSPRGAVADRYSVLLARLGDITLQSPDLTGKDSQ